MVVEVEDLNLIEDGFSFSHGLGEMKIKLQVVGGKSGGAGIDLLHDCRFTFGKNRYSVGGSVLSSRLDPAASLDNGDLDPSRTSG